MFDEFLEKAAELRSRGESFAIAMVVRFEAPISGKPGDKAIIDSGGRIWGWIGGRLRPADGNQGSPERDRAMPSRGWFESALRRTRLRKTASLNTP